MKKNLIFKIISVFICLVFAVSAFSVCVGAATNGFGFVSWEMSEDGTMINSSNGEYYFLYDADIHLRMSPRNVYAYGGEIFAPTGTTGSGASSYDYHLVYSYSQDGQIICIKDAKEQIYATFEGKKIIDDFLESDDNYYVITDTEEAEIDEYLFAVLEDLRDVFISDPSNAKLVSPHMLKGGLYCTLAKRDIDTGLTYEYGSVYGLDGQYYYFDYSDAGSSMFDVNGKLNYSKTTKVRIYPLSGYALENVIASCNNMTAIYTTTEYEQPRESTSEFFTYPIEVFWVMFALVGVVAPLSVVGVAVILSNSKKRGYPKHWMAAAIAATVWLLLSLVVLMLLLI